MKKQHRSSIIWGGAILAILIILYLLSRSGGQTPSDGSSTDSIGRGSLSAPVTSEDHSKGNPDAPVTLVEYSDFQCPACASIYPLVKQLSLEFGGNIKIVYRHFPLSQTHKNAEISAQASEAAGMQGQFWEFHDMLFNTQKIWSDRPDADVYFTSLAESLGLDKEQFITDMNSRSVREKMLKDYTTGNASGVNGTPSFFLNGTRIQNPPSYESFRIIIEQAIGSAGSTTATE